MYNSPGISIALLIFITVGIGFNLSQPLLINGLLTFQNNQFPLSQHLSLWSFSFLVYQDVVLFEPFLFLVYQDIVLSKLFFLLSFPFFFRGPMSSLSLVPFFGLSRYCPLWAFPFLVYQDIVSAFPFFWSFSFLIFLFFQGPTFSVALVPFSNRCETPTKSTGPMSLLAHHQIHPPSGPSVLAGTWSFLQSMCDPHQIHLPLGPNVLIGTPPNPPHLVPNVLWHSFLSPIDGRPHQIHPLRGPASLAHRLVSTPFGEEPPYWHLARIPFATAQAHH